MTDHVKPFPATLQEMRRGGAVEDLTTALAEVVAAVVDTRKKGCLTLKVEVAPLDKSTGSSTVTLRDKITTVVPEHDREASVFFAADNGALTRNDPRQPTFDEALKLVDTTTGELRELPTTPTDIRTIA